MGGDGEMEDDNEDAFWGQGGVLEYSGIF
jgi:hypothetical protein